MHSYKATNGTIFHYSSDLSGDVIIIKPDSKKFEVDGNELREFVEAIQRIELTSAFENAEISLQDIFKHWK